MPDTLPEDISNYAKFGYLMFGDGYQSQILQMHPSTDQENKPTFKLILRPSNEQIKAFNIKPGSPGFIPRSDGSILVEKEIPYDKIKCLNPDPAWTRWFYLGDWNGNLTPAIQELLPTHLNEQILELKKIVETEKLKRAVAEEKMKLMESNLPKYFNKYITPMLADVIDSAGKLIPQRPGEKNG